MSQNKNGGALHLYRSDSLIRLPDAGKLSRALTAREDYAPRMLEMRNHN